MIIYFSRHMRFAECYASTVQLTMLGTINWLNKDAYEEIIFLESFLKIYICSSLISSRAFNTNSHIN